MEIENPYTKINNGCISARQMLWDFYQNSFNEGLGKDEAINKARALFIKHFDAPEFVVIVEDTFNDHFADLEWST